MSTLLDKIPSNLVVNKRGSKKTGRYGLYVEAIAYVETTGWFAREVRVLVLDNMVATYSRKRGRKAGRWVSETFDPSERGLNASLKASAADKIRELENLGYAVVLRGDPILVELSPEDLGALRCKEMPALRYSVDAYGSSVWGERTPDETFTPDSVKPLTLDYGAVDEEDEDGLAPASSASDPVAPIPAAGLSSGWIEAF